MDLTQSYSFRPVAQRRPPLARRRPVLARCVIRTTMTAYSIANPSSEVRIELLQIVTTRLASRIAKGSRRTALAVSHRAAPYYLPRSPGRTGASLQVHNRTIAQVRE